MPHAELQIHAKRQLDLKRKFRVNSSQGKMALVHAARYHAIQESIRESSRKRTIRSRRPSNTGPLAYSQPTMEMPPPQSQFDIRSGQTEEKILEFVGAAAVTPDSP